MASVKSRNQRHERSRKDEDDFRNWRSPHHKSNADHFRQGSRSRDHDTHVRENGSLDNAGTGNHRTRYRHDRESKPRHWSNDRRAAPKSRKLDVQSSSEFPALGAKTKHADERKESGQTPDPIRPLGQRHSSTSSTDWASQIDQFKKDKERALRDMMRYKRRLLMSQSSDGSSEDQENLKINMNAEPKKEYETDETVIIRRQKQLAIGKNTLGYDNYLQQVPKYKRVKHVHIGTPNKFQKCSRRAWDGIIRQWRKQLHDYDPEGTYKPARVTRKELHFSDTTSEATSEASSEPEVRMDIDFNNSTSSAISDYLASNESSRPETPEQTSRPETPTTELKGLTVRDHVNGNYQTSDFDVTTLDSKNVSTPDATLTPTVTPADHPAEGQPLGPQISPSDLIAALRHATQVVQPSYVTPVYPVTFQPNMYCAPPQQTSNLNPHFPADVASRSFHCSHDDNANAKKQNENGDIFDNFNLDDCFLSEDDIIG